MQSAGILGSTRRGLFLGISDAQEHVWNGVHVGHAWRQLMASRTLVATDEAY
jgi:hypothetical protein